MSSSSLIQEAKSVPHGRVLRYTFRERVCHAGVGTSYLYCLLTGLAFYTPYLYWLSTVLGSGATSRFWHPWVGLVFCAGIAWMYAMWSREMAATPEDREWNKKVKYYVTHQDNLLPPQGRFNAGQKLFYWVVFYASIVLLITGVVMWFPEMIAGRAHWLLTILVPLHAAAALVSIGGFIIHVYMGVLMIPGSFKVIVLGHDDDDWAKQNHRLWFDKIKKLENEPKK
jgi:formate dehydrogenase subunit gamma